MRLWILSLCLLLCGCASSVARIGPQAGGAALRLDGDDLYVNPELLGFGEFSDNITVTTGHDNSMSFEIAPARKPAPARKEGSAFRQAQPRNGSVMD